MYPRHAQKPKEQARVEKDARGRREFLRAGLALGLATALPFDVVAGEREEVLARYAERLFFHEENRNELRL